MKNMTLPQEEKAGIKININSFRIKLILVMILSMLALIAVSGLLLNQSALDGQQKQLRNQLLAVAQIAALSVDSRLLKQIPLDRSGIDTLPYKRTEEHLQRILQANATISDIYILTATGEKGIWQFIVDIDTPNSSKGKPNTAYPGDRYNAARFPQMMKGYEVPTSDESVETDEWGATLSGYAPIRDEGGNAIAVLGVDMGADVLIQTEREIKRNIWLILAAGLIVSVLLGIWMSARITRRVIHLAQGTHRLAGGDLQYRVDVRGRDEIGQLARAFNRMAQSLEEARQQLNGYFIRIVQSLVLSLEAKDAYTAGHSIRVAQYAAQIAARIGLSAEKVEALKEAALLHDIGKLGIPGNILNKQGPLTLQERAEINSHPARGGKILKPICLDEDMLAVVVGHHERYDGEGYPDGLAGEQISIYARITTVADTYDAMTSSRAYRPAMDKAVAIGELEKARGTQLDPRLVDAFIEILKEESSNSAPVQVA